MFFGIILVLTIALALSIAWILKELPAAPVVPNDEPAMPSYKEAA